QTRRCGPRWPPGRGPGPKPTTGPDTTPRSPRPSGERSSNGIPGSGADDRPAPGLHHGRPDPPAGRLPGPPQVVRPVRPNLAVPARLRPDLRDPGDHQPRLRPPGPRRRPHLRGEPPCDLGAGLVPGGLLQPARAAAVAGRPPGPRAVVDRSGPGLMPR